MQQQAAAAGVKHHLIRTRKDDMQFAGDGENISVPFLIPEKELLFHRYDFLGNA